MATRPADVLSSGDSASPQRHFRLPPAASWKLVIFYVGIPLATCVYGTLNNWQLLGSLGFLSTFGFYAANAAAPWALTALLTLLAWRILAGWRLGLVTLCVLGSVASCALTIPYTTWLTATWADGAVVQTWGGPADFHWRWIDIANYTLRATLIWIGVNLLFDRYFGLPRYRYPAGASPVAAEGSFTSPESGDVMNVEFGKLAANAIPAFMQRLRKPAHPDHLVALRAEQHYLRVITTEGGELVLYRMSDAVRELPENLGVQVHRSWWVRRDAIAGVDSKGRKMTLRLINGLRVPVSTPYQGLVRAFRGHAQLPAE